MLVPNKNQHIALSLSLAACFTFWSFQDPAQGQSHEAHGASTGGPSRANPSASVYFVDVKSGDTLQPKTVIHFGLRNMGVSAAGTVKQNTGHHHLLIDVDLPPLDQPIPNDDNHLHYGSGQTEAEINLAPGPHTLQLLVGDKDHIPHTPPIMSDKISVNVVEGGSGVQARSSGQSPSPPNARVYFESPGAGACIARRSVVRFGLVGMGVAPAGIAKANTGHHHLIIDSPLPPLDQPIPNDENHLHFGAGQTQAEVDLTPGSHKLQLLLADESHIPHQPAIYSQPIQVTVDCKVRRKQKSRRYTRKRNYNNRD
jgi:hypothetical protein